MHIQDFMVNGLKSVFWTLLKTAEQKCPMNCILKVCGYLKNSEKSQKHLWSASIFPRLVLQIKHRQDLGSLTYLAITFLLTYQPRPFLERFHSSEFLSGSPSFLLRFLMLQEMHVVAQSSWLPGYQPALIFGRRLCTHNPGYSQWKGQVSVKKEREEDGVLPSDRHISKSK